MASGADQECKVVQCVSACIHQDVYSSDEVKEADKAVAKLRFTQGEDYAEYKETIGLEISRFESVVDRFCEKHKLTAYRERLMDGAHSDVNTECFTSIYCTMKGKGDVVYGAFASNKVSDKKIDVAFAIYYKRFLHVVFDDVHYISRGEEPKRLTARQQQHLQIHCVDRARKKFSAKYSALRPK